VGHTGERKKNHDKEEKRNLEIGRGWQRKKEGEKLELEGKAPAQIWPEGAHKKKGGHHGRGGSLGGGGFEGNGEEKN